jgi:hypothetical protein
LRWLRRWRRFRRGDGLEKKMIEKVEKIEMVEERSWLKS